MNYKIRYINENGYTLCNSTGTFIPRIGEKMRMQDGYPGITFVITDVIYEFKSGMSQYQEVTIHIKPV